MPPPTTGERSLTDGLTPAERGRLRVIWLFVFGAVATGSIGMGIRLDDWLTLRQLYGPERVRRESLHILNGKPIRVSNGDTLGYSQPFDWVLPLSLIGGTLAGALVATRALPRDGRTALRRPGRDEVYGSVSPLAWAPGAVMMVGLFFLNAAARVIWYAPLLSAAAVVVAIVTGWARYGRTADNAQRPAV
jgi:hypothetical protein